MRIAIAVAAALLLSGCELLLGGNHGRDDGNASDAGDLPATSPHACAEPTLPLDCPLTMSVGGQTLTFDTATALILSSVRSGSYEAELLDTTRRYSLFLFALVPPQSCPTVSDLSKIGQPVEVEVYGPSDEKLATSEFGGGSGTFTLDGYYGTNTIGATRILSFSCPECTVPGYSGKPAVTLNGNCHLIEHI